MKVIKLSSDYADKVSELYKQELEEFYLLGTAYQSPKLANYLKFICEEELEEFFGIIQDNELVAVIQYKKSDSYLHINHMVVTAPYQGFGLGKKLLSWAIQQAELSNLNMSLDVDSINKKAFDWYLSSGFQIDSEKKFSVLELNSRNPSTIVYHDNENLLNFGYSNVYIKGLEELEFFFIEPNSLLLKNEVMIENDLLERLSGAIDGLLIVKSDFTSKEVLSTSMYDKVVIGMVKDIINKY